MMQDQKIAAFGSSYSLSGVGAAEGCDLLILLLCLSQTATDVAILDAGNLAQAGFKGVIFAQLIEKKGYRQAGTLRVLLIADVSLASVSGSPPTAETIKTISHKNKKAPCEVRR